jgi:hypothetical protein
MRYLTARNEHIFGLKTDVIGRNPLRDKPDNFLVAECENWHITHLRCQTVASIPHRALLARAMPVRIVAWGVTIPA